MRLIFLDIDGVLNHGYDPSRVTVHPVTGWGGQHPPDYNEGFNYFVESCVIALNALTRSTGAKIVISSAWREVHPLDELRTILRRAGVEGDIIDITPFDIDDAEGLPAARITEIGLFLDLREPGSVESFVVLDDNDIRMDTNNVKIRDPLIESRFVQMITKRGLGEGEMFTAARLLVTPLTSTQRSS